MKFLFTILILAVTLSLSKGYATNYYFSSSTGDDSRSVAQAHDPATPWKSIPKLNAIFTTLQPGDSVLFKRGDTFYGGIICNKSGTASLPIIISAYGSGARPVITSFVTLTGWTLSGANVYRSAQNTFLTTTCNVVTINGVPQQIGRYPNANATNKGYLTFESHSGKTSITDAQLTASPSWAGAEVVVRTRNWILDRSKIKSHSGSTLTLNTPVTYDPYDNFGYFIQNDIRTIDQFGEWYFDSTNKKINIGMDVNNPASYSIQATSINNLVYSKNFNYITFNEITFDGANMYCFYLDNGQNFIIKNCTISNAGFDGIRFISHPNYIVQSCLVKDCNNGGIVATPGSSGGTVRRDTVVNIQTRAGMGQNGELQGYGIRAYNSDNLIEYNQVSNIGYVGIGFYAGNNITVRNNFIDRFCVVKDDGSGIYTYVGSSDSTDYTNRKIINNIIINGIGVKEGTTSSGGAADGIYGDQNTNGLLIQNNTVYNVSNNGAYINEDRDVTILDNLFYNGKRAINIAANGNGLPTTGLIVKRNVFAAGLITNLTGFFTSKSEVANFASFGVIDSNWYMRPLDDVSHIRTKTDLGTTSYTLATWKPAYGFDAHSKGTPKSYASTINYADSIRLVYNNTEAAKTISLAGTYINHKKDTFNNSITLQPYTGMLLLKVNDVAVVQTPVVNTPPTVSLTAPANAASFVAPATVNITATASDVNGNITSVKFYNGATLLNSDNTAPYAYTWAGVAAGTYTITAVATDNNGVSTTSSAKTITVTVPDPVNVLPTISITAPTTGSVVANPANINITATASDADGTIASVAFYNGSILLNTDNVSPYAYTWSATTGTYNITAVATDNTGATTTSGPVTITVNAPPTISLTAPANASVFTAPSSVNIAATASDVGGSIASVKFYNGATLLNTDNTAPYAYTWSGVAAGTYTITAVATDNNGYTATSTAVTITVNAPPVGNVAPSVSITAPLTGSNYVGPATITLAATASDADGTISTVQFFNGSVLLHTENLTPFGYTWQNVGSGTYTITAVAKDNTGATTTSSPITVTVGEQKLRGRYKFRTQ